MQGTVMNILPLNKIISEFQSDQNRPITEARNIAIASLTRPYEKTEQVDKYIKLLASFAGITSDANNEGGILEVFSEMHREILISDELKDAENYFRESLYIETERACLEWSKSKDKKDMAAYLTACLVVFFETFLPKGFTKKRSIFRVIGPKIKYVRDQWDSNIVSHQNNQQIVMGMKQALAGIHETSITNIKEIGKFSETEIQRITAFSNEQIKKVEGDIRTQVSAAVEALKADATLTEAYALWNKKEAAHKTNFTTGIGLFLATIVVIISLACMIFPYVNFFPDLSKLSKDEILKFNEYPYILSRVAILSTALALCTWILRAILRWANMNLSLAEDAAQRRVLANTYVNLLATEKEHMPEERAIMLNAIFRPLPGVREMDVEPTTIVDIIKAARGK